MNRLNARVLLGLAIKAAKLMVHTIRMRHVIVHSRLPVFLLTLALAHGLIASSLLVECMPADGTSLIELIGQDPCHGPFGGPEINGNARHELSLRMWDDPTGPCVDLSLEGFAISVGLMKINTPDASVASPPAGAYPHTSMSCLAPAAESFFKQAREPGIAADSDTQPHSPLRI